MSTSVHITEDAFNLAQISPFTPVPEPSSRTFLFSTSLVNTFSPNMNVADQTRNPVLKGTLSQSRSSFTFILSTLDEAVLLVVVAVLSSSSFSISRAADRSISKREMSSRTMIFSCAKVRYATSMTRDDAFSQKKK
jgi:hypothetical protein